MGDKVKERIVTIYLTFSILIYCLCVLIPTDIRFKVEVVTNAFGILLLAFLFYDRKQGKVIRPQKKTWLLFIVAVAFIANGIYFAFLGYMSIGIVLIGVYPLLGFIGVANGNWSDFLRIVSKSVHYSFIGTLILSILIGPSLAAEQYESILANPNSLGTYLDAVLVCELYLLHKEEQGERRNYFRMVLIGAALAMIFFSASRTGELGALLTLICYAVYRILIVGDKKKVLSCVLIIAISTAVMLPVEFMALTKVNPTVKPAVVELSKPVPYLYEKLSDPMTFRTRVIGEELPDDELLEILEESFKRLGKGWLIEGSFTSSRALIWIYFLNNISWYGHEKEEVELSLSTRYYDSVNAHNSFLQVAYSAGAIAGVAFLLFYLIVLKDVIAGFIKRRKDKVDDDGLLFLIMAFGAFTAQALLSYTFIPATTLTAMIFWVAVSPTLWEKRNES